MTIVELVVAVAIVAVFVVVVANSYAVLLRLAFSNTQKIKAVFLLEDTLEAVKFLKTANWQEHIQPLQSESDYFLSFNGNSWAVSDENVFIDGLFERKFILEDVYRDGAGQIVDPASGNLDESTKKVTAFVSWQKGSATTTRLMSTYIAEL